MPTKAMPTPPMTPHSPPAPPFRRETGVGVRSSSESRARRGRAAGALVGLLACCGMVAGAATDALHLRDEHASDKGTHELIDRTLGSRAVRLLGWDDNAVTIIDERGVRRDEPLASILAVRRNDGATRWRRPSPDRLAGGTAVVIETTDGQRFIGSLGPWDSEEIEANARRAVAQSNDPEAIALLAISPGALGAENGERGAPSPEAVSLESVGRILIDPWRVGVAKASDWTPGTDDTLIFANGDHLDGFLVAIDGEIRFEADAGELAFPLDRVAELRLGNPPSEAVGPRLWLVSGEVRDGRFLPGHAAHSDLASSDAIDAAWFADRDRTPLADLEQRSAQPLAGRRWSPPPRSGSHWDSLLGIPDIAFDGPVRTEWALPIDADAFSAVAVLGATLDRPDAPPGPWASVVLRLAVRVGDDERTLAEIALDPATPRAPIGLELPGVGEPRRMLIVEISEGAHGPIQDRVLLRRPFVLE